MQHAWSLIDKRWLPIKKWYCTTWFQKCKNLIISQFRSFTCHLSFQIITKSNSWHLMPDCILYCCCYNSIKGKCASEKQVKKNNQLVKKYQRDPSKGSNYRELISKPLQNNWFKLLEIPGEINPSEIDFLTASQNFL